MGELGIGSRADPPEARPRVDAEIRHEVVQEVLRGVLAVQEGVVRVEVHDGVVILVGWLRLRTAAGLAARLAARVSGVVDVVDRLGFEVDDAPVGAAGGDTRSQGVVSASGPAQRHPVICGASSP